MKISDLFRQLSFGELSNLAISTSGSGTIIQAKWPQLIQYTNDALDAIHQRFALIEKELLIEQAADITVYQLKSKYAVSVNDPDVEHHYIQDTEDNPFQDDLLRVLEVWGVDGKQRSLNDQQDPHSLFTPAPLQLQIPVPVDGQPISVIYQAAHVLLADTAAEGEDADTVLDQEFDVPRYLQNALQQLVASKVYSHMNGQENILKGQEYLANYERDCLAIEDKDLANQSWQTSHTKLEQRGFV